jgi:hypothetical protein
MSQRLILEVTNGDLVPMRATDLVCSFGESTEHPSVAIRTGEREVVMLYYADPQPLPAYMRERKAAELTSVRQMEFNSVDRGLLTIALTYYHEYLSNLPKDANVAGTRAHVGRLLDIINEAV